MKHKETRYSRGDFVIWDWGLYYGLDPHQKEEGGLVVLDDPGPEATQVYVLCLDGERRWIRKEHLRPGCPTAVIEQNVGVIEGGSVVTGVKIERLG